MKLYQSVYHALTFSCDSKHPLCFSPSGLCLEKVPAASPALSNKNSGSPSSNRSTTDRDQDIINCYEKSGDIALLYLQEAEKVCVCASVCVCTDRRNRKSCTVIYNCLFITSLLLKVIRVRPKSRSTRKSYFERLGGFYCKVSLGSLTWEG